MAFSRILRTPNLSQTLTPRSRRRKAFRQEMVFSLLRNPNGAPGRNNSCRLNPSGTGRFGSWAWTIDSTTTIARVQEDIWYRKLPSSVISGGTDGTYSRG